MKFLKIGMVVLLIWRLIGGSGISLTPGMRVRISGTVTSLPRLYYSGEKFRVGKLEINTFEQSGVDLGDKVIVEGEVTSARTIRATKVEVFDRGSGDLGLGIRQVREKAVEIINRFLPEPEAGLMAGVLLGSKQEVDFGFSQALKRTGTTHMVVASGTNVTFAGGAVVGLLAYAVGRKAAYLGAIVAVWLFAIMAGSDAPVVRAASMGSISYLGLIAGRATDVLRLLAVTGWIMVMVKPELARDIGFQLSFAATLGIVLAGKSVQKVKFAGRVPNAIMQTLAATIFTLPVIMVHFGAGNLAWSAPLVNILVGWMVGPIMILGTGLLALNWLPGVGQFIAGFAYAMTHLFVIIVSFFSAKSM